MKQKLAPPSHYASLDIGTSSIKAALSLYQPPGKLELISLASVPLRAVTNGFITNLESVSEAIREVLAKVEMIAGHRVPPLSVNVSSAQSQGFRSHGIVAVAGNDANGDREVTLSDIARVVEMANSISVPADRLILHSIPYRFLVDNMEVEEPNGAYGIRLESEVYLVTHNKAAVESIHKAVLKAERHLSAIALQTIASAEGVVNEDEKKMGTLLIEIGGNQTDYILLKHGSIVLTGTLPVGADHITKDLAYGLKTTFTHAETLKLRYGSAQSRQQYDTTDYITVPLASQNRTARVPHRVLGQIIEPRLSEILSLVKQQAEHTRQTNADYTSIVLSGGGALTQDIVDITEDIFQLPARIGKPLITSAVQEDAYSPAYATLIGLQRMAMEQWERSHKPSPLPVPSAVTVAGTSSPNNQLSRLGSYFKNLFH